MQTKKDITRAKRSGNDALLRIRELANMFRRDRQNSRACICEDAADAIERAEEQRDRARAEINRYCHGECTEHPGACDECRVPAALADEPEGD
jgi:hypothetical protein